MALCTCLGRSGVIMGDLSLVAEGWKVFEVSTPSNHGIHSWKTDRSWGVSCQFNIFSSNVMPVFSQYKRNTASVGVGVVVGCCGLL